MAWGVLTGRDTLDTTTTGETANGGLRDTLDVVAKNLAVTLGTTLSETLATLSACVDVSDARRDGGDVGSTHVQSY